MKQAKSEEVFGTKGGSTSSENSKGKMLIVVGGKIYPIKNKKKVSLKR